MQPTGDLARVGGRVGTEPSEVEIGYDC